MDKIKNSMRLMLSIASVVILVSPNANAISFTGQKLFGGGSLISSVDDRSYDSPEHNAFVPFESFTDTSNALVLDSFSTTSDDLYLEATLLSESAGYANRNSFGVVSGSGYYNQMLSGGNVPGDTGAMIVSGEQENKFALKSPQGIFTTSDSDNPDRSTHIVALEVTTAGTVFIEPTTLSGGSLTFNLLVGDILLFMEDLLVLGNVNNKNPSDFDYNDMVVVVRASEIPEPATSLLFSVGLASIGLARRKRRAVSRALS